VNRTDRLYALVDELRGAAPRARSARWLADRFEVSTRTVERDLLALQQAGVPIWATPGPGGGYSLDPAMTLPPMNFTPAEAAAIAVALATATDRSIPFGDAGRTAMRKIVSAMAAGSRRGAEDLAGRIHLFNPHDRDKPAPQGVLHTVEAAVAERRVLKLNYVDRSGARTQGRLVEPAALVGGQKAWYLVGWCRLRVGGRAFRLDRIQEAALTDESAPDRNLSEVAGGLMEWVRSLSLDL
jgi:predicted DNA-binding transcriptional regulator YafY